MAFDDSALLELLKDVTPAVKWAELGTDHSLDDAGLDSLDKATLFMKLEDKTGLQIPDSDYDNLDTRQSILDYVAAKKGA
jgi:acyl carrier protein